MGREYKCRFCSFTSEDLILLQKHELECYHKMQENANLAIAAARGESAQKLNEVRQEYIKHRDAFIAQYVINDKGESIIWADDFTLFEPLLSVDTNIRSANTVTPMSLSAFRKKKIKESQDVKVVEADASVTDLLKLLFGENWRSQLPLRED